MQRRIEWFGAEGALRLQKSSREWNAATVGYFNLHRKRKMLPQLNILSNELLQKYFRWHEYAFATLFRGMCLSWKVNGI